MNKPSLLIILFCSIVDKYIDLKSCCRRTRGPPPLVFLGSEEKRFDERGLPDGYGGKCDGSCRTDIGRRKRTEQGADAVSSAGRSSGTDADQYDSLSRYV